SLVPLTPYSSLFPYTTLFRSFLIAPHLRNECQIAEIEHRPSFVMKTVIDFPPCNIQRLEMIFVEPAFVFVDMVDASFKQIVGRQDRKSTRLNSSHVKISYAVF